MLKLRGEDGLKVAILPLTLTVPLTNTLPVVVFRMKVPVFSVDTAIASEKVAEIDEFAARPVAASAGDVTVIVGGVVLILKLVVNFHVKLAGSAFPAASATPVVRVAVYCVFAVRLIGG